MIKNEYNMENITLIIGLIASIFGLCIRIPQIYKVVVTKSATDLSYVSIFIANSNQLLWFTYSYLREDMSLMISSVGHFIIISILLTAKCYYDRKKRLTNVVI